MSAPIMYHHRCRAIFAASKHITSSWRMVLLAISDHLEDGEDYSWPSFSRLADMTGLSRRQAIRVIHAMEAADVILAEKSTGRATRYMIDWDRLTTYIPQVVTPRHQSTTAKVVTPRHPGGDTTSPDQCHHVTPVVTPRHPKKGREEGKEEGKRRGGRASLHRSPVTAPTPTSPSLDPEISKREVHAPPPSKAAWTSEVLLSCWQSAWSQSGRGCAPSSSRRDRQVWMPKLIAELTGEACTTVAFTAALTAWLVAQEAGAPRVFPPQGETPKIGHIKGVYRAYLPSRTKTFSPPPPWEARHLGSPAPLWLPEDAEQWVSGHRGELNHLRASGAGDAELRRWLKPRVSDPEAVLAVLERAA